MNVQKNDHVPEGQHVLLKDGKVVWAGPIASTPERIDFDTTIMSPADYRSFREHVRRIIN